MGAHISGGGTYSNTTLSDRCEHIFLGGGNDSNTTLSDRWEHIFQEEELTVIQHCPTDGSTYFRRNWSNTTLSDIMLTQI